MRSNTEQLRAHYVRKGVRVPSLLQIELFAIKNGGLSNERLGKIMVARKVAAGDFNDVRFALKQQIDEYLDELRRARCMPIDPLGAKVTNRRLYALLQQSA